VNLQRKLGFFTVLAVVMGDMIGSGIFFTPGELAAVASAEWQVYFFWTLCGLITLCGALTLAELSTLLPRAGVAYHALNEAYGPFAGFMQAWIMVLVSGPGAIAGIAILFGELANQVFGTGSAGLQLGWAVSAIVFFGLINLRGAEYGGGTQILLTGIKIAGLAALVAGGLYLADASAPPPGTATAPPGDVGWFEMLRFVGLGVSIVLFTYDGWIDASNVAGEVRNPTRNFPRAMGFGVVGITTIYLVVNYAYLRVVPLEAMRDSPTLVAPAVAEAAFGSTGGLMLNALMWISIFGALGGLVFTLPRLYYAAASEYRPLASGTAMAPFFNGLSFLSSRTAVPAGAILFACGISIGALFFFGSFQRIVTFFVVPFQFMNILMVASVFRLRPRLSGPGAWRMPFFPLMPIVFIVVMLLFLVAAILFNPLDSLAGVALTLAGVPVYRALAKRRGLSS